MLIERRLRALLLTLLVSGLAGCGGETSGNDGGGAATEQSQSAPTQEQSSGSDFAGTSGSCDDIPVPGHEATNVRVEGVSCTRAAEVAAAALGKGRRPYEAAGFTCEPSDAGGGDTSYTCTRGDARVTFGYGTRWRQQ
ncbi:MAG: hypothetical protein M3459_10705 [Actinomycetota bacterium]|nr:hypothetical protein [Actinomycetota bacterium]